MNDSSRSSRAPEPLPYEDAEAGPTLPPSRMYLSEPGWRIGVKSGSARILLHEGPRPGFLSSPAR